MSDQSQVPLGLVVLEHLELPPPPKKKKIVVEIWCYLPEIYTLGEESEIQGIFSKKCEKSQFSIEILIKKSHNFLEIFQKFLLFWSKRAKFCRPVAYFYLPNGKHSSNLDDLAFFYKFPPIFPKLFKNFHAIFNSPLSKLFFELFFTNFSVRY